MIEELRWFSPSGERFNATKYSPEELIEKFYPNEHPKYPTEFLYYNGWAKLYRDDLVIKGIGLAYRGELSKESFKAIDKYVNTHFKDSELSNRFKTDWAYEKQYY